MASTTSKRSAVSNTANGTFLSLLGEAIRTARETRGYSQEHLANIAGLSRKQVNRLESGQHSPTLNSLLGVLRALGESSLEPVAARMLLALVSTEAISKQES